MITILTLLLVIASLLIVIFCCVMLTVGIILIVKSNKASCAAYDANNIEADAAEKSENEERTENKVTENTCACEEEAPPDTENCSENTGAAPTIIINNLNMNG